MLPQSIKSWCQDWSTQAKSGSSLRNLYCPTACLLILLVYRTTFRHWCRSSLRLRVQLGTELWWSVHCKSQPFNSLWVLLGYSVHSSRQHMRSKKMWASLPTRMLWIEMINIDSGISKGQPQHALIQPKPMLLVHQMWNGLCVVLVENHWLGWTWTHTSHIDFLPGINHHVLSFHPIP